MANVILLQKGDLKSSDFTNDNSNNEEGIGVRVSPDNGNLLQQRKNGLYYGIEAPPDLTNLYVSSSMGDDSNTGTRNAPLKTIREAIIRNNVGTKFNIFIYEDDVHNWHGTWTNIASGKLFTIMPYGSTTDTCRLRNRVGSWDIWFSKEIKRPTIKFIYNGQVSVGSIVYEMNKMATMSDPAKGSYRFFAVTLDYTDVAGREHNMDFQAQLSSFGSASTAVDLHLVGCDLKLDNKASLFTVGGAASIILQGCVLDTSMGNQLGTVDVAGFLNLALPNVNASEVSTVPPPNQVPLTIRVTTPTTEFGPTIRGISSATVSKFNTKTSSTIF